MKKYISCVYVMMIVVSCMSTQIYADTPQFNFCTDSAEAAMRLAYRWLTEVDIENAQVELIKTLEMRFCYISFVRINGKEYIVKQKKSDYFKKIVSVVRDAITAHVAEDFGIAHRVAIIPAGKKFPGKPRTDWPATLHTIAPGKMIKAQESNYDGMNIKQADIGFRRDMLPWMMKHPTLIKVVALDTFLCNHDRHRGNLFYQQRTDSFCAIDMDSSFKYNLCALACKNFTAMLNDKKVKFSRAEIEILKKYKEHLEFLIDGHTPEDTLELYDYFVEQAGFVPGAEIYTQKVALEIERNRRMIRESYKDVQALIPILDNLIKKSRERLKKGL